MKKRWIPTASAVFSLSLAALYWIQGSLLEFINVWIREGLTLTALFSFLIFIKKLFQDHKYNQFNRHMEQNIHAIMQKLEVEQWKDTKTLWNEEATSLKKLYLSSHTGYHPGNRRKNMKLKALTSSISKKLVAFVITAGVSALNSKLGLNIDPNAIYGLYALTIAYVLGQSHVDAKRVLSSAVNASAGVLSNASTTTTGQPIQTVTAPPMSYDEVLPYVNDVHAEIMKLYDTVKSGKYDTATQEAVNVYMTLHDYLKKAGEQNATAQPEKQHTA